MRGLDTARSVGEWTLMVWVKVYIATCQVKYCWYNHDGKYCDEIMSDGKRTLPSVFMGSVEVFV